MSRGTARNKRFMTIWGKNCWTMGFLDLMRVFWPVSSRLIKIGRGAEYRTGKMDRLVRMPHMAEELCANLLDAIQDQGNLIGEFMSTWDISKPISNGLRSMMGCMLCSRASCEQLLINLRRWGGQGYYPIDMFRTLRPCRNETSERSSPQFHR
jgi:hypothetical protein